LISRKTLSAILGERTAKLFQAFADGTVSLRLEREVAIHKIYLSSFKGAKVFGERIRSGIFESAIQLPGEDDQIVQVTVSVGAVSVQEHVFATCGEVIAAANAKLDAAKSAGCNRVSYH